jgi:hypothetical protein
MRWEASFRLKLMMNYGEKEEIKMDDPFISLVEVTTIVHFGID